MEDGRIFRDQNTVRGAAEETQSAHDAENEPGAFDKSKKNELKKRHFPTIYIYNF